MVSKTVTVTDELGLHMRPAGELAKAVSAYSDCKVTLNANGKSINAGSVMQIMTACIKKGCQVEIVCDGTDERTVLEKISEIIE